MGLLRNSSANLYTEESSSGSIFPSISTHIDNEISQDIVGKDIESDFVICDAEAALIFGENSQIGISPSDDSPTKTSLDVLSDTAFF